jgi:hypothetical protein
MSTAQSGFGPAASIWWGWGTEGSYQSARLPIPVKRATGLRLAAFQIYYPWAKADEPAEEGKRERDKVTAPMNVCYGDPATGKLEVRVGIDWREEVAGGGRAHFGIPTPPDGVVGHFSDPQWLPKDRVELLRRRIYAALDVLLPFFADENRPWTEAANKAAQEVRDFFPLAAEPGLWPYYKAEGKEFFAWVERSAPPGKAALPWNVPARPQ